MDSSMTGRERVLKKASDITQHDRNKAYGNPEDNFQNIADVWQWYLQDRIRDQNKHLVLEGIDVAHMMALMKYARLKTNRLHEDSIVDVAGYAACAGDFVKPPPVETAAIYNTGLPGGNVSKETNAIWLTAEAARIESWRRAGGTARWKLQSKLDRYVFDPIYWRVDPDNPNELFQVHALSMEPQHQPKFIG